MIMIGGCEDESDDDNDMMMTMKMIRIMRMIRMVKMTRTTKKRLILRMMRMVRITRRRRRRTTTTTTPAAIAGFVVDLENQNGGTSLAVTARHALCLISCFGGSLLLTAGRTLQCNFTICLQMMNYTVANRSPINRDDPHIKSK